MARICWAIVFIFLGLTPSFGRQCVLPGGGDDKPALSGAVEDDAKELGFVWQSRAYKNPNWEIENRICNDGKSNLIVSWPKTDLFATAYRPLKSGNSLLNSYSVLAEPTAGSSEITYGYVGTTTSAKHYETKAAAVTLPRLNSRIEAVLVSEEKPSENFVVAFYFEASPKDGSYEFKFYPKTPAARFFTVGFSSSQNKLFAEAFQQQKKKMFVGSLGQVSVTSGGLGKTLRAN